MFIETKDSLIISTSNVEKFEITAGNILVAKTTSGEAIGILDVAEYAEEHTMDMAYRCIIAAMLSILDSKCQSMSFSDIKSYIEDEFDRLGESDK